MQEVGGFLGDLAVVLSVAAVSTVLFQKLRQSAVLGYLIAGLLIGPHVLGVGDQETLHTLSELGVVLLMFTLGLEFRVKKLLNIGPRSGAIGAVEIGFMCWLGFLVGRAFGWGTAESVFLGAMLSISSTMIVSKAFAEARTERGVRELAFGILVVEDVVAVMMLATLSAIAGGGELNATSILTNLVKLAGLLVLLVSAGLLIVPRFIGMVVRSGNPETSLVATIGICFAGALLAQEFGYSAGLGAFLAGSLAAESGQGRSLKLLVRPVRDMFAAIFFVAVGMLIDPALIWEHGPAILTLTGVVILGKLFGVTVGSILTGHGTQKAIRAGLSLTQIGEFSFMIAAVALPLGETARFLYPVAVAVCVLTAFTSGFLVRWSGPIAAACDRLLPAPVHTFVSYYGTWLEGMRGKKGPSSPWARLRRLFLLLIFDAVLLVGLVIGVSLALPSLESLLYEWTGLLPEVSRVLIRSAAAVGSIPFGLGIFRCVRQLGFLLAAEALPDADPALDRLDAPRRTLVLGLQVTILLAVGMPILAVTQPFLPLSPGLFLLGSGIVGVAFLFWRTTSKLEGHVRAGTVMIADVLARQSRASQPLALDHVEELLPGLGTLTPLSIESGDVAEGATLVELNLRGRTGATVVCISRGEGEVLAPSGEDRLQAGDVLILSGPTESIRTARLLLKARGEESTPLAG